MGLGPCGFVQGWWVESSRSLGQLWDERTAKVGREHKLQGGMLKTIYFSYANGASDLKLYLPSKKNIYIPLCFGVFLPA